MTSNVLKKIMKILVKMSDSELHSLYQYLGGKMIPPEMRSDFYVSLMNEVTGLNIKDRSRRRDVVWGRYIVIHELLLDGWSSTKVGYVFGMDHSSVSHASSQVEMMLDMPGMYSMEYDIYRKFKSYIYNEELCLES